jgi:hypothetical protein
MIKIAGTNGDTLLDATLPSSADTLSIYDVNLTGATPPATCAASPTGTLLTTFTLGSPWVPAASGGQKPVNGTPITSASVAVTGTPAYWRITNSGTTKIQGTIGRVGTLDPSGQPWDLTTDGLRFTAESTVNLASMIFVALNNDA